MGRIIGSNAFFRGYIHLIHWNSQIHFKRGVRYLYIQRENLLIQYLCRSSRLTPKTIGFSLGCVVCLLLLSVQCSLGKCQKYPPARWLFSTNLLLDTGYGFYRRYKTKSFFHHESTMFQDLQLYFEQIQVCSLYSLFCFSLYLF